MGRLSSFWSSLKCTVALFLGLALLCVAGSILPQRAEGPVAGQGLSAWVLARLSFFDLFHSIWFVGPTGLLILNLVLCMLPRMRRPSGHLPAFPRSHGVTLSVEGTQLALKERIIRSAPYDLRLKETQSTGAMVLFGEASCWRRWAVLGMHASIPLIVAGMLMGVFGIDGHIELRKGQTATEALAQDGSAMALGFAVRCDDFRMERYPGGMPREYVSRVTFIQDGRRQWQGDLTVNHPLRHHGLRFYQESYRQEAVGILDISDGIRTRSFSIHVGDAIPLDGVRRYCKVEALGERVMNMGPAVKLVFAPQAGPDHLWVFKDIARIQQALPDLFLHAPTFNPGLMAPYTFTLRRVGSNYVTGLGVRRDPGVPLVAAGGAFLLAGLLIVFLVPVRRVWLRLEGDGDMTLVQAAATRGGRPMEFPAGWMTQIRKGGAV